MSMDKFKEQVLRVGQQASFAVQMKGKKGTISASVNSPSGESIECSVAELDEGTFSFVVVAPPFKFTTFLFSFWFLGVCCWLVLIMSIMFS